MVNDMLEGRMLDETKKDKIMLASLEEFAKHGFEKASTERISKAAGVSKGLIFHYFTSKENLYMTTMNRCIDDVMEEFNNVEIRETDFISKLVKMMKIKYDFFIRNPLHYKLMVNGFYHSSKRMQTKLKQRYVELKQIGLDAIIDMIKVLPLKKGVSVDDVAVLLASVSNIVESRYVSFFSDDTESFEKFYDTAGSEYIRMINIIMYGIIENENLSGDSGRGESCE